MTTINRLSFGLTVVLAVMFTLVLAAFRAQPPPNPLPEIEGAPCTAPCWQGIQPGITPKETALTRLTAFKGFAPIRPMCYGPSVTPCENYHWVSPENVHIWTGLRTQHDLVLTVEAKTPGFTLGEALLSLDNLPHGFHTFQLGRNLNVLYLWLSFSDASISVSAESPCPASFFTLMHAPVDTVTVQAPYDGQQHIPVTLGRLRHAIYDLCEQ